MTTRTITGYAFHCHHDKLVEYVYDYAERVNVIKRDKPKGEQELRLRLFRMIPEDKVPEEIAAAKKAWGEAWEVYCKKNGDEEYNSYARTKDAYKKVMADWDANELHNELCPDCPWDGVTIFPDIDSK